MLKGICVQCSYMDQAETVDGLDVLFSAHAKESKHRSYVYHYTSQEILREIPE